MPDPLPFLSLATLAAMLERGETTSQAIVEACLARIDRLDQRVHAFVEVYRDDALRLAQACDLERRAGFARGPLHGLPIAIKDLFHIERRATTAGAKHWSGRIAERTASCIERLLAAGMIPLGKTHMVEFAFGTWGTNRPMGAPWNPWDAQVHRVCGGSSSGSAAAVAAGMAPAALGSDTGGSVRIPAALCGVTGLKLTYGVISLAGVVPLSATLDSVGPITRSVEDAALLAQAMAAADPADPATLAVRQRRIEPRRQRDEVDLSGVRVALLAELPDVVDRDTANALAACADTLRGLGAAIERVASPIDFAQLGTKNGRIIAAEAYAVHRAYIEDEAIEFDPGVRSRIAGGKGVTAADYLDLLAERREACRRFESWMQGRDALLVPAVPYPAIPLAQVDEAVSHMPVFTRAVNYLGACALALPAGFTAQGMPIGVQLVGRAHAEPALIGIGRAFQRVTDWHMRRPMMEA